MKLKLLCFGITKEIMGGFMQEISINEGETVTNLKENLQKQFPQLRELASLNIAINEDYPAADYVLQATDEVVLIPPVSGG